MNLRTVTLHRTALKYLACAALVVITLTIADPVSLFKAIIGANLFLLGLVVVLYVLNLAVKSYRWSLLLKGPDEKIPFRIFFKNYTFAQAINNITPGMVGDATKIYGVNSNTGVKIGACAASVATERLMDLMLTTAIAFTGVIMLAPLLMIGVLSQLNMVIGIAAIANLVIIYILIRPSILRKVGNGVIGLVGKVAPGKFGQNITIKLSGFLDSFTTAMVPSKSGMNRKALVGAGALTFMIWSNEIARVCLIMMALGAPINVAAIMVVTSLSALSGILLVAGSSNIFVSSSVFSAVGVDAGTAAGAGVLSALTSIWISVPIGILAMLIGDRYNHKDRVNVDLQIEQQQR